MSIDSTASNKSDLPYTIDLLFAIVSAGFPFGWNMIFPPNILLGCVCWALTLLAVLDFFRRWSSNAGRFKKTRWLIILTAPICIVLFSWKPIANQYRLQHSSLIKQWYLKIAKVEAYYVDPNNVPNPGRVSITDPVFHLIADVNGQKYVMPVMEQWASPEKFSGIRFPIAMDSEQYAVSFSGSILRNNKTNLTMLSDEQSDKFESTNFPTYGEYSITVLNYPDRASEHGTTLTIHYKITN